MSGEPPSEPSAASGTSARALGAVVRAVLLLSAEGASLALAARFAALGDAKGFFGGNQTSPDERRAILVAGLVGALLPLAVAAFVALEAPRDAERRLRRAAALGAPLLVAAFVPPLLAVELWVQRPLGFLLLLGVSALVLEWGLTRMLRARSAWLGPVPAMLEAPRRVSRWIPLLTVLAGACGYALYTAYWTIVRLRTFGSGSYDLGIYDNLMASALSGHPFRAPILMGPAGGNYIAGHAEFAMLLFLPLYAVRPGAETLLVLQALLLGFAAVPLYFFASTQVPRGWAAAIAIAYLLYAPLHGAQYYDFHWLTVTVFFHFWLFYGIAMRRTWIVVVTVPILFALREDVAVGIAVVGLFLLLTGKRPRFGALLFAVSTGWFAIDKFVIMPAAGGWWFENIYKDLIAPGEAGYGSIVKTLVTNPVYVLSTLQTEVKLLFALHLLAPLLFIPLRRPYLALLACPGFFFTLLTTGYGATVSPSYQYVVHWIPYLFAAAIVYLGRLVQTGAAERMRSVAMALCLGVVGHSYVFGAVLHPSSFQGGLSPMTPEQTERYRQFRSLADMVPRRASIAATDPETPLLSARPVVYSLYWHRPVTDYLLIERDYVNVGSVRANLRDVLQRERYGLVATEGGRYYLFGRGQSSDGTRAAVVALGIEPKDVGL